LGDAQIGQGATFWTTHGGYTPAAPAQRTGGLGDQASMSRHPPQTRSSTPTYDESKIINDGVYKVINGVHSVNGTDKKLPKKMSGLIINGGEFIVANKSSGSRPKKRRPKNLGDGERQTKREKTASESEHSESVGVAPSQATTNPAGSSGSERTSRLTQNNSSPNRRRRMEARNSLLTGSQASGYTHSATTLPAGSSGSERTSRLPQNNSSPDGVEIIRRYREARFGSLTAPQASGSPHSATTHPAESSGGEPASVSHPNPSPDVHPPSTPEPPRSPEWRW